MVGEKKIMRAHDGCALTSQDCAKKETFSASDKEVRLGFEKHEKVSEQGAIENLKESFPEMNGKIMRVIWY